ncbi:hypothetical protein [Streptomyces sp. WA6-1-16]|uniref:hypothetical protein n=1 Tax=Streptomyces sp. WA6-1-16 TaxID=2879427 RepID=UPI003999930E
MTTFQVPRRMTFSAVSPQVFKAVPALGAEIAQLIALIFTVNAWNRMNVITRKTPGTP